MPLAATRNMVLGDEKDEAVFVDIISKALSVNKTPTMIYGRRVEAMFAYMTASLGKCALVKINKYNITEDYYLKCSDKIVI